MKQKLYVTCIPLLTKADISARGTLPESGGFHHSKPYFNSKQAVVICVNRLLLKMFKGFDRIMHLIRLLQFCNNSYLTFGRFFFIMLINSSFNKRSIKVAYEFLLISSFFLLKSFFKRPHKHNTSLVLAKSGTFADGY